MPRFVWREAFVAMTVAACARPPAPQPAPASAPIAIVVHGGAGTIRREQMTPERAAALRRDLEAAVRAGYAILAAGGSSLDAVEAAVRVLEDSPLFNAGRGAVLTADGTVELDASIMDGAAFRAGAVASLRTVKNPIHLARLVMERTPHVLLVGEGAERFAREMGVEIVDPSYFITPERRQQWERLRARPPASEEDAGATAFGTVGAVALDRQGRLAAATSTGGTMNKRPGRVGDSPIIGAGTYANRRCAVSATGTGEFFIRNAVAYDICARMEYLGQSIEEAARAVVLEKLVAQGGDGGVIALDARGRMAMPFNTPGMYRAWAGPDGRVEVRFYRDED